jgi:beta-glucanase (GH16 family)
MSRLHLATAAVAVLALGVALGTTAATAASPNDVACRKLIHGSVSRSEQVAYEACRFDKLDAAVKALTPTAAPTSGADVTTGPATGAVLFQDDFTGTGSYDHDKWGEWSTATYNGSAAYGSIKPGDRAALDGQGHLSIPATPTAGTSVSTKDDFTFLYGTVTARMKVPAVAGYWPAFWTLNNNPDGHDSLPLGEADIHESYTGLADYYHRGTHSWNDGQTWGSPGDPACGRDHVFGEWHDYAATFAPEKVTFFFDGVQCGEVTTKADGGGKPYGFGPDVTRGSWLLLTLAVGGAGGQQDGKAVAPAQLLVDSVKVTAL